MAAGARESITAARFRPRPNEKPLPPPRRGDLAVFCRRGERERVRRMRSAGRSNDDDRRRLRGAGERRRGVGARRVGDGLRLREEYPPRRLGLGERRRGE